MAREPNLYHNLVTNEDTLTELLANLLQFPDFKNVKELIRFVGDAAALCSGLEEIK